MSVQPFRRYPEGAVGGVAKGLRVPESARLRDAVARAAGSLEAAQDASGYWSYEFEADCTIPAEYILMMHYMDEVDAGLEAKIAAYLRARQGSDGGWPLYPGDALDLSCTVKVYYALKLAGDDPACAHMVRAREAVLARGGAVRANVFTHIALALFGQIPWRAVPFIPAEIMLLPKWFPFHIDKVSYWSRTVMVPLFALCTLKPQAVNPRGVGIDELFTVPPEQERDFFPVRSGLNRLFLLFDMAGRAIEPLVPKAIRRRALQAVERWVVERLNGYDGLGAIFPAMVNAYEMLAALGYPADHPLRMQAREALRRLLVVKEHEAYCQPCLSPVWDTALAAVALQEHEGGDSAAALRGLDWLKDRQLLDAPGDWRRDRPDLRGGGWPFEFGNGHYPDIDDTPVVAWAMLETGLSRFDEAVARAAEWIEGMQSSNGGWASFDIDNTHEYLNEIPFADHGALLDPPTADVTARCVTLLSKYDAARYRNAIARGLAFLRANQEADGCWFGRWGTNYIYGTWSVLLALEAARVDRSEPWVRRGVQWLESVQRADGGWGEDNHSYHDPAMRGRAACSTSFQTAWALLGLMAAGEMDSVALHRGVEYLLSHQQQGGGWSDEAFTAPGFPRVFYLKYHGYSHYFPLWALARYRKLSVRG